ncbi:MAG: hypothetical protein K9G46_02755 [Flavobacteriales bacterium]|nr:hypothetical protein [Flavobacteriales bacterium]
MSRGTDNDMMGMIWETIKSIGRLIMWIAVATLKLLVFLLQAVENLFRVILK